MTDYKIFNIEADKLNYEFGFNPKETSSIHNKLNNNSNLNINDMRRIALWKLDRVLNIPDEIIENLNKLASDKNLSHRDDISIKTIKDLVKCEGVGFPMASSILKFIRPDIYPIIDVRAYRALKGKKLYYSSYTLDLYLDYVDNLVQFSKLFKMPLKQIDEQLYEFDKKYNGKI
jgi:hypothetical protein